MSIKKTNTWNIKWEKDNLGIETNSENNFIYLYIKPKNQEALESTTVILKEQLKDMIELLKEVDNELNNKTDKIITK